MTHIKKFNESIQEFNLDFAISKIKENFSNDRVQEMFSEEWPNWVDDEYSDDLSWYMENSNAEAEEIVYERIIDWFRKEFIENLSTKDENLLLDTIKKIYKL